MRAAVWIVLFAACGDDTGVAPVDARDGDAEGVDAAPDAPAAPVLGMVTNVRDLAACPTGAPPNTRCKAVTVSGCPGIESEMLDATIAIAAPTGGAALKGTVSHWSGSGGTGFQIGAAAQYAQAGYQQVFVAWDSAWEQTASSGIKAAGCRPATLLKFLFDDAAVHGGSRTTAFCAEGFSGGSGQLGYALAHYGAHELLDYVNELSGPPFARIDLGCDGSAPATATVCGDTVTMRLPSVLDMWENIPAPQFCGATGVPAAEVARWKSDSIAVGGVYAYPKTRVEFFDCTNNATAVTAMAQLYHTEIAAAGGASSTGYHCYTQADGCMGEGLGNAGNRAAADALIAGCTPRHQ